VKLVRLRRPKVACSFFYVYYKPKTNAALLRDMGHTKGRSCTRHVGKRKENKNLNEVDVQERI
jgi:hypothetical protein